MKKLWNGLKKYIPSAIACLIACVVFSQGIVVHASPLTSGSAKTFTYSVDYSDTSISFTEMNNSWGIETNTIEDVSGKEQYKYFHMVYNIKKAFETSTDVYAYKVNIAPTVSKFNSSYVLDTNIALGTMDSIESNKAMLGRPVDTETDTVLWFVNDYGKQNLYAFHHAYVKNCIYFDGNDESDSTTGSYVLKADYVYTFTPYTEEDLLDEIYSEIVKQSGQNEQIISKLEDILVEDMDTNDKLETIYSLVKKELTDIQANQSDEIMILDNISVYVYGIFSHLTESESYDKNQVEQFGSTSNSQSNQLHELNQTKPNKIDIDSTSSSIDSNIDMDSVGQYGLLLSTFTNNEHMLKMLLITFSIALIGYVLFGKGK